MSLPIDIIVTTNLASCAKKCLESKTLCLGINYDSGSKTCELLVDFEGPDVYLRKVDASHSFIICKLRHQCIH